VEEVELRLQAMRHSNIMGSFKIVPFLPALHGGVWGRYLVSLYEHNKNIEQALITTLSGLEDSLHNAVFFTRKLPVTSLFCFSRTKEELNLILRETGITNEPLDILSYNFPFPASISEEERTLLRLINQSGNALPNILASTLHKDVQWVKAKLKRLLLHSHNPQGVAILRSTIHWYRIDNFIHAHIILPIQAKPHLAKLCNGLKWMKLKWPAETPETIAIEADFSGWGEFAEWKEFMDIAGFSILGFAFAAEERIHGKGFEF